jgi:hypothetical protein
MPEKLWLESSDGAIAALASRQEPLEESPAAPLGELLA